MGYQEIYQWLQNTVSRLFGVHFTLQEENQSVLDRLGSVDLLYLYYEVWKQYQVYLSVDEIQADVFSTPKGLSLAILGHLT